MELPFVLFYFIFSFLGYGMDWNWLVMLVASLVIAFYHSQRASKQRDRAT